MVVSGGWLYHKSQKKIKLALDIRQCKPVHTKKNLKRFCWRPSAKCAIGRKKMRDERWRREGKGIASGVCARASDQNSFVHPCKRVVVCLGSKQFSGEMESASSILLGSRLQVQSLLPQQSRRIHLRYPPSVVVCKQSTTTAAAPSLILGTFSFGSSSLSLFIFFFSSFSFFSVFFASMVINLFRKRGGRVFLWSCVPRPPPC